MKHQRLSAIFLAVSAASLLMVSTAGMAAHSHKATKVAAQQENYKGENFKAEVPPPCPPIMMLHDGFYIGAGLGYDSYRIHQSTDLTAYELDVLPATVEFTSASSANTSATGWMGGIFAGYGRYFDTFYIAAEINANTSNADSTFSYNNSLGVSANTKVKARTSYGIAILPGIKLNDSSLLYVRLGYLRTNFKASASFSSLDFDESTVNSLSVSDSAWRNGFNYGVGIETYVAEDISIRGEYTHTSFNSKTISGQFTNTTTLDSVVVSDKFDVSNNEFMLSLLYHFC
jgi:outer membrane immunogenic protein